MSSHHHLLNGILYLKLSLYSHTIVGFYFTPSNSESKCLIIDNKLNKIYPLSQILSSGRFSEIKYRELTQKMDITRFKLALVNMQNSFPTIHDYHVYVDYIIKAVGENPSERLNQCHGSCYREHGPIQNIPSYDPFEPITIYHRTTPPLNSEDIDYLKTITLNLSTIILPDKSNNSLNNSSIPDTLFLSFLHNIIEVGNAVETHAPVNQLPLSYRLSPDFMTSLSEKEKITLPWESSIYSCSCWEIAMWLLNDGECNMIDIIRLRRTTYQFKSIIGNNINSSEAFKYLEALPSKNLKRELATPQPIDPEGLAFRKISNYYNYHPITYQPTAWSPSTLSWSDLVPSLYDNAWFYGISPRIRLKKLDYSLGFISILPNMMCENGGFYHTPISENLPLIQLTQDNAIMYAFLSEFNTFLTPKHFYEMKKGLKSYFKSVCDKNNYLFYHGKKDSGEIIKEGILVRKAGLVPFTVAPTAVYMPKYLGEISNYYLISTADQIWSICCLQPHLIDKFFGERGATLKMWNNLKDACGRLDSDGSLQGFGYNNLTPSFDQAMGTIISTELTFGAMTVCKILLKYYQRMANKGAYTVEDDLYQMEKFIYDPKNGLLNIDTQEAYFKESNLKAQTGFGEISYPYPNTIATSWHIFYAHNFNPFINIL